MLSGCTGVKGGKGKKDERGCGKELGSGIGMDRGWETKKRIRGKEGSGRVERGGLRERRRGLVEDKKS